MEGFVLQAVSSILGGVAGGYIATALQRRRQEGR